jgi:hypothetical protein
MTEQTQKHTHLNHFRAGLQHKILQSRSRINHHNQNIQDIDRQTLAVEREFGKHADIHGLRYRNVDGFESATYRVESQMDSANHYLWGVVGSVIIAIVFGVYFSVTTLISHSFWTLFFGTVLVAVLIGVLASLILRSIFNATAVNPQAIKNVNITLAASGIVFFVLLALFAWLRFNSNAPLAEYLPAIMVGIELSALIFAGACDCGFRMYRWSQRLNDKHRHFLNRRAALEDDLAEEHLTLKELEHRLHHEDSTPPATHHPKHAHPASSHPVKPVHHHNHPESEHPDSVHVHENNGEFHNENGTHHENKHQGEHHYEKEQQHIIG